MRCFKVLRAPIVLYQKQLSVSLPIPPPRDQVLQSLQIQRPRDEFRAHLDGWQPVEVDHEARTQYRSIMVGTERPTMSPSSWKYSRV
jgi:hypothetical protein